MDNKKICFITAVNGDLSYQESLFYIRQLALPTGMSMECIAVRNAWSITEAYNLAMGMSDAKYKVYLHQDVHIIHQAFIQDIVTIFSSDEQIGLLGMSGVEKYPENGPWWNGDKKLGAAYESVSLVMQKTLFDIPSGLFGDVEAIDGLLMATQHDIPWRQDLFDGWHMYDISQSFEFRKNGYRVVVPRQVNAAGEPTPWCLHDCSVIREDNGYHKYVEVFHREYGR